MTRGRLSRLILALPLLLLAAGPAGAGEADEASLGILMQTLRANRKALVDVNLELSDEEASAFWPVYDSYQADLAKVQDRLVALVEGYAKDYATMTDEGALKLVDEYLEIEADRIEVRQNHREAISGALPGRAVMRFYQIENKIEAVLRYDLAASIPVVKQ
jgi:hypothetical protein